MDRRLTVVLDAKLASGSSGGVEQFIIGLASGLRELEGGLERYMFLTEPGHSNWLDPFMGGPCQTVPCSAKPRARLRRAARSIPGLGRAWQQLGHHLAPWSGRLPPSDGTVERLGADVIHFTKQSGFRTSIPTIYHPHDLQHLHFPELFTGKTRHDREVSYRALCAQARFVVVASEWMKQDLVEKYHLQPQKIRVIPMAPPLAAYGEPAEETIQAVRLRHRLPERFAFYPAHMWPHKNHLGLIEAAALLREQGIHVPLVFTGARTDYTIVLEKRIRQVGLEGAVQWLGFVDPPELAAVYRLSTVVVVPTLFEAVSFPVFEAFLAGVPVACSNVTSLPRQVGDASLLFSPTQPRDIADKLARLWTDAGLASDLSTRGRKRVARFTWRNSAIRFRALYRCIAKTLTDEDRDLLAEEPSL